MVLVSLIIWLVSLLIILLSVAFFTLFERKVIGLIHSRVGPNNVSFLGLLQPLLDAFNLLANSQPLPSLAVSKVYYFSPYLSLGFSLILWLTVPFMYASFSINLSLLVFIFVTSLIVFPLLVSGWASNSNYSLIGCLRSIAQSISYEAVFSTLLILIFIIFSSYSVSSVASMKFLSLLVLLPIWVFSVLAECHRAPFDFSESESELVSGFNTEYMGGLFAFIFLSEYCSLLVSCSIIAYVFGGFILNGLISYVLLVLVISFVFIVIRVTFSRFRYDKLIILAWKSLLPSTLFLLLAGFMLI